MLLLELVLPMALKPIIDFPIAKSIERTKVCNPNLRVFLVGPKMVMGGRIQFRWPESREATLLCCERTDSGRKVELGPEDWTTS